jgi:hypothetical protein
MNFIMPIAALQGTITNLTSILTIRINVENSLLFFFFFFFWMQTHTLVFAVDMETGQILRNYKSNHTHSLLLQ